MKKLYDCRFLRLHAFKIEKGYQPKNALIFIENGWLEYNIGGVRRQCGPHQLISFPEEVYFERKVKEPIDIYYIRFDNPQKEPLPVGNIPIENIGRLISTLQYLLQLENIPGGNELKNALLEDIFLQIRVEKLLPPTLADSEILLLTDYLQKNMHRKLSLKEVADAVYLSSNGLIHHCKNKLGLTPMEYLNRLRIERAETLLCSSNQSVAQIARLCGFENPYYFSNVFKKLRGLSPSAWRKKYFP